MKEDKQPLEREVGDREAANGQGGLSVPDPIARNPKDLGPAGAEVQPAAVHRRHGIPAPVSDGAGSPGWSGTAVRYVQGAASAAELLTPVVRYKWTLLAVALAVSGPLIALIWTQIIPQYQAWAEIRVRPIIPQIVFRMEDNGMIPQYESFVNTQVSTIRSLGVLRRVVEDPNVQETQWYQDRPRTLWQRLRGEMLLPEERLWACLSVRPRPRTQIIDLSFSADDRTEARTILNKVLEKYLDVADEVSLSEGNDLTGALQRGPEELVKDVNALEKHRKQFCSILQTDNPQELIASRRVRLDEAQARLHDLEQRIQVLEEQRRQIDAASKDLSADSAGEKEKGPKYYEDEEWCRLDLNVKSTQHQIDNSVQGPNHPGRIRAEKDLKFAKELRQDREKQLYTQWQERQEIIAAEIGADSTPRYVGLAETAAALTRQLATTRLQQQLLEKDVKDQADKLNGLLTTAQGLEQVNNELRLKQELLNAIQRRKEQKEIERNAPGVISTQASAYVLSRPQNDRRMVFTAMALCAGLGLGGGATFLRAGRNPAIFTAKEIPQPPRTPFLGHVPLVRLEKPLGPALCEEIQHKQFLLTESIRMLRTALLSQLERQGQSTVLVTSANEGTGKSSVTLVLGRSLAQTGRKVLLVDADLHKKTLSMRLNLTDQPGFRESLKKGAGDGLYVFPSEMANLDFMPAGRRGKAEVGEIVFEEIANGTFQNCLRRLFEKGGYDIILLDTPAVLPIADAAILAGQVDGAIMVERESVSRREEVAHAFSRLDAAGGRLLGTVFVSSVPHESYRHRYGSNHCDAKTSRS